MDAGLPDAITLTKHVYDKLGSPRSRGEQALFGYVIAKLIVRQTRLGLSPFQGLNVEEVYDALKRFIARDTDALAEFVYSWDPITAPSGASFQPDQFAQLVGSAFSLRRGLDQVGISTDGSKLRAAGQLITDALQPLTVRGDIAEALRPYLDVLIDCINLPKSKHPYLDKIISYADTHALAISTLNYDTLLEDSCEQQKLKYDYGLSRWNERKYVRFSGAGLKLLKLHGSTNWFEDGDNIIVSPEKAGYRKRAMIFGGQNEKLVPNGPYLQLRHEFQRIMRQTNILGIIGYSFQDVHLNALVRAWISSKVKAKLVIMDPSPPRLDTSVLGKWYTQDKKGNLKYNVEIDHICATAAEGMDKFLKSLETPPNPTHPKPVTLSPRVLRQP